MMREKPCFAATMMGAVPYREMDRAAGIILECLPEAPSLPIMTRGIRWMLEGIPCLVFDRERRIVYFDLSTEREGEILDFYDHIEADDLDYFATTSKTAPFFYDMIERIQSSRPAELKWVLFHTSGPLLFGDMLKQADGTPSIHNETLRDILIKGLNVKARWLEKKIRAEIPGVEVVADLPETTLVNFTSSAGTGSRDGIIEAINLSFANVEGLSWVHCCANIDWSLLFDSKVRIVNFDAYQHAEQVALYAQDIQSFLKRGGMLGWGIVPVVSDHLRGETAESLIQRLEEGIDRLVKRGIDEKILAESSWVLPSCETVLLTPEESDRALKITSQISQAMKKKYGFKCS
ncbi:MAG: hypothetical protein HY787_12245 [Deltaproteobacteria bacterium]|nr:hypothetical protein [Deltaproteobacteria bacterium]